MAKYLLFRTDRIGDFIFSRIIIDAIKKKNPNNTIDIVCSEYNANYVKNFRDINQIYIYNKYRVILNIKNLINLNSKRYDYLLVLDGKRRSIFLSLLINSKIKIALIKNWRPLNLLKIFFNNYLINSELNSQYKNFSVLLNYINLQISNNIDYYKNYNFKEKKKNIKSNYILLHLDEKWFKGFYFDDFENIDLNKKNFIYFIEKLFKKFNKSIILTTGRMNVPIFNDIINKHFNKINDKEYVSIKFNHKLIFFNNNDFQDLELFVKYSSLVICCEGAISHVSHAFKKKTIALINGFETAKFWTNHMPKIKLIKRGSIDFICKEIMKL